MSIISYITDLHLLHKNPEKRKDNLVENQFLKYAEYIEYTNKLKAIPIQGGDFSDIHRPPLAFVNKLDEYTAKLHTPLLSVLGNHDIIGYNQKTYKDCAIGNLTASGLSTIMEASFVVDGCEIIPYHFTSSHSLDWYKNLKFKTDRRIIFSHNMIVKHFVFYPHILAEEVLKVLPENTLLISGHYHAPFDVKQGTKRSLNPGSFLRKELMKANDRTPMILKINTDTLGVEFVPIKSALPFSEAFDFNINDLQEEVLPEALTLDNIKLHLDKIELTPKNVFDVLSTMSTSMGVEAEVLQEALKYIQQAEADLCQKN